MHKSGVMNLLQLPHHFCSATAIYTLFGSHCIDPVFFNGGEYIWLLRNKNDVVIEVNSSHQIYATVHFLPHPSIWILCGTDKSIPFKNDVVTEVNIAIYMIFFNAMEVRFAWVIIFLFYFGYAAVAFNSSTFFVRNNLIAQLIVNVSLVCNVVIKFCSRF